MDRASEASHVIDHQSFDSRSTNNKRLNLLSVEEWEVDELLEWTNGLNFDEYYADWKTIGTTAHSDKLASKGVLFLSLILKT